ncbi:prepilin-type N-terminal cleavage/methylation domain-containing protein [Candidatus Sumerlaeota bacterium]|nr:prepilin-type N-terminal cleavage/methylation domain-containing protein [Candidatus Sumerlaeota bacterium]
MSTRFSRGFTLIELLIVVAIIAILAAIAVPNFLEAQVRSKIARVKSDLRSLSIAEEAYRVDWNSYTFVQPAGTYTPWGSAGYWAGFRQLTTPVAYVTSIPFDPFGASRYSATLVHPSVYELGCGAAGVGTANYAWAPGRGMPSDVYEIESDGPDKYDDTRGEFSTGAFPLWPSNQRVNDPAMAAQITQMIYDPTNGTVSSGDIFKVGGNKPGGLVFDVFWSCVSR